MWLLSGTRGVLLGLTVACAVLVGGGGGAPRPAWAQAANAFPNAAIGVIDIQHILADSLAAKAARSERERYLKKYQDEARKEEQSLHEAQAALAREADQQSEAFKQKRLAFEKRVAAFQSRFNTLRQNLDRAMAQALAQVQDMVIQKADEVAGERGINLVLYKNQVLLFDPRMNMTDEVLRRVDAVLKTVTFPNPESLTPENN